MDDAKPDAALGVNLQYVANQEVTEAAPQEELEGEFLEMELECEHAQENLSLSNLSLTMHFAFFDAA